ncbi:MarR family transcriptional regulator [Streptomyces fulvoviolaceus]|uniref:MarR family transcriptional regulator n=1 Tax=Streptomyces fulvoviolaceus TaxID=285535 RepID=UPI000A6C6914|nr:helix-turn-helix domain-containing protein [Streptomyces fulvoviolaceus]MCT9079965.1 MarR family transcriptional regulator [Streptomyces fulvoviolaceus]
MSLSIGLVVHASRRGVFEEAVEPLSGISLKWVTYGHEHEIRPRVQSLADGHALDGLLVGAVPYRACRDVLSPGLPVAVTRSSALDLALALSQAQARGWQPVPVSIDTFDHEVVSEVTEALHIDRTRVACLPYADDQYVDEICAFHQRSLREGGGYVITARTAVLRQLRGTLRVLNGSPVPSSIRSELHELVLRIRSERAGAAGFAAGVFCVNRRGGHGDLERSRMGLLHLLRATPELSDAWIENRGRRGVVVLGRRTLFERLSRDWLVVPVLDQAQEALGVGVSAGFGVGPSARSSVMLAERAAARAESEDRPCGYLMEDSGLVIGPMGLGGPPQPRSDQEQGDLSGLARTVGLSPATLSRLAAIEGDLAGRAVTPSELADAMAVTDPSGRRLVRKLHAHGLVTSEGLAQTHRKGRPTGLYRLAIVAAMTGVADGDALPTG